MSKLKDTDLRDEEDDRREALQKAFRLYAKAQEAYYTKGPSEQQLRRFEEAEAALGQQLQGGLMGLRENELELVLKGRLHQAVITAHLQESPDCWQKVKALVEDVLQYDFQNCHARWLRGLSLLHGFQRHAEAKEEMLRAVESAKRQGKAGEVKQWMDQIRSSFSDMQEEEAAPPPQQKEKEKEAHGSGGGSSSSSSKQQQQKKKGGTGAEEQQDHAQEPAKQAGGSSSSSSASNKKKSSTPEEQRILEERAQELQKQVAKLQQDLEKAHHDHEAQKSARESAHLAEVQALVQHFEELFEQQPEVGQQKSEEAKPMAKPVADLCTTVGKIKEQMQADKLWLEGGHQKYVDFSTEVLTLREMSAREWKERSDASKKHITELQDLGQKLTELKGTARAVREHIKTLTAAADDAASLDEQHFARCAARFHALPLRLRLQGFLEDVVVLRLLLFVVIAGMLTMLAFSVEVFGGQGRQQCRLACTGMR